MMFSLLLRSGSAEFEPVQLPVAAPATLVVLCEFRDLPALLPPLCSALRPILRCSRITRGPKPALLLLLSADQGRRLIKISTESPRLTSSKSAATTAVELLIWALRDTTVPVLFRLASVLQPLKRSSRQNIEAARTDSFFSALIRLEKLIRNKAGVYLRGDLTASL